MHLPMPSGGYARFRVVESQVLAPALAAKYPEIKTYTGQGIDDPAATASIDITPLGFRAQIISGGKQAFVDPYLKDGSLYAAYSREDLGPQPPFACEVIEAEGVMAKQAVSKAARTGDALRTYRLAVACTGEYATFYGGTVAGALGGITTTFNRVSQILELEFTIRFELIANNDQLIFLDPDTDPFTNDDKRVLIDESKTVIDSIIGPANYDIGHTLGTRGGGVAQVPAICVSGKARGVSGTSNPVGDAFNVDLVAHEVGHQLGARHTFNGIRGSCFSNRTPTSAYEPGGGTTIMAYDGICGADNIANVNDPMYHSHSHDQILDWVDSGTGASCAVTTPTGNAPPQAEAGLNYTIPKLTPFTLTGSGSDADLDTLTYTWEQRDLGEQVVLEANDDGMIPLVRAFPPSTAPTRTIPRLDVILNQGNVDSMFWEKLPAVSRAMDFRFTVRDNVAGAGGSATDDMVVNVIDTAGPFMVTTPDACAEIDGGAVVEWDVANTNLPPISALNVNILLSTDGGQTFPVTLAANTANDGSEAVTLPNVDTSTARVKVEAVGNIFFDISDEDFVIGTAGPCGPGNPPPPAPPANDECADAIEVFKDTLFSANNVNATGTFSSTCAPADLNDVWFRYNAVATETVFFSLCGSPFDTTISVFSGCGGLGAELACNDDQCGSQSEVSLAVAAGQDYYIRVAGYGGLSGPFALSVSETSSTGPGPAVEDPPAVGSLDFCSVLDDDSLQLVIDAVIVALGEDLGDLTEVLQQLSCATADINGPVLGEVPTPNGIFDEYELGLVEAVYNNPLAGADGGPPHSDTVAAFINNYELIYAAVEDALAASDFEGLILLLNPDFTRQVATVFGGFATLGDPETIGALQVVIDLIDELGVKPPTLEQFDFSQASFYGPGGDADGDGCTNREEYEAFGFPAGGSAVDYSDAAFDAFLTAPVCQCPGQPLEVQTVGETVRSVRAGQNLTLRVNACSGFGNPQYQWFFTPASGVKQAQPVGGNADTLVFDGIAQNQAGEYFCEVTDSVDSISSGAFTVEVSPGVSVAHPWWLGILIAGMMAACAITWRKAAISQPSS